MLRSLSSRILAIALCAALPSFAFAQRGRIIGTVSDTSRAAIAGAQVIVSPSGISVNRARTEG